MAVTFGIGALTRACSGFWQYLVERGRGRTQLQLEQVRNQGTAQAICLLPRGSELWETEPGGRTRVIRIPASTGDGPAESRPHRMELPPR
jgi:hypothetical protein